MVPAVVCHLQLLHLRQQTTANQQAGKAERLIKLKIPDTWFMGRVNRGLAKIMPDFLKFVLESFFEQGIRGVCSTPAHRVESMLFAAALLLLCTPSILPPLRDCSISPLFEGCFAKSFVNSKAQQRKTTVATDSNTPLMLR
jgi:hypothetical protein